MRLLLTRLRLVNWKCYRDETINLHQDDEKNISVIFGNNGFGKTSLLEAIRWCLYGSDSVSKQDLISRFHRVGVKNDPAVSLMVQLTFRRDQSIILISRSCKRVLRHSSVDVDIEEPTYNLDGRDLLNPRGLIEDLLPRACSDFYFFDGVEIKRYAQKVHSNEMRSSIERILGIPELRNLREDGSKALHQIDQELSAIESQKPEMTAVTRELQDKLDEQLVLKEQIDLASSEHEAAVGLLENLQTEASAYELLRAQIEDLERKRRDIERLNRDLTDLDVTIDVAMRQIPIALLSSYVTDVVSDLQRKSLTSARRSGISSQLRSILEHAVCICGRELDEQSRAHILAQLGSDANSGTIRAAMIEESERNQIEILALFKPPHFGDLLAKRNRIEDDIDGLNQEIDQIRGKTDLPSISLSDLWRQVGDAEANVRSRRETIESLRRDQAGIDSEILSLRRKREHLATTSAETASLGRQALLARRMLEATEELIDWRISETRDEIERTTTKFHLAVTNKPMEYTGVEISGEDYSLRVRHASGELLDPDTLSAGEKEALAFAFIAGLNITSGKSAPFIMDTPFGHLDISHQRNLVTALPDLPSQVTLLATDRDLPEPLLEEIRGSMADTLMISRVGGTEDASVVSGD